MTKMNHRVTLLNRATERDAAGQKADTWAELGSIWADVRFQTGAEVLRANAETSVVRVSIRIRARSDVDNGMRVRYLANEYDIESALPDSSNCQFMFLVCRRVE